MAPLDYLAAHSRKPLRKTESWGAIPQSATLTAPFTQRGLCAVRQCVPFPLAAQVRQWGPRGSPASAGSSDGRYAPKPPLCKGRWLGFRGPGEAQRQRVRWGEEEQRSDCAFRPQGGNKGCGACDDEGPLACLSPLSFFTRRKMVPPAGAGRSVRQNNKK